MLNRRSLLGAAAVLPLIPRSVLGDEVPNHPDTVRAGRIISLSPNGERAILQQEDQSLIMMDLATGEELATAPRSPHTRLMDPRSVTWKRDSSGIAFAIAAFQIFAKGLILGLDEGDHDLRAITGDITADTKMEFGDDSDIDTLPVYGNDGLYFSRSIMGGERSTTRLMYLPSGADEPELISEVSDSLPGVLLGPAWVHDDDSLSCLATLDDYFNCQIMRFLPDGDALTLSGPGGPGSPFNVLAMGNNGTRFCVVDVAAFTFWILDVGEASAATPGVEPVATPQVESTWTLTEEFFGEGNVLPLRLHTQDERMVMVSAQNDMLHLYDGTHVNTWGSLENWQGTSNAFDYFWNAETLLIATTGRYWVIDTTGMPRG